MASSFSQLILDVENLDRSLQFYEGILHLSVQHHSNLDGVKLASLLAGKTEVILVQRSPFEQNSAYDRAGGVVLNFNVNNLLGLFTEIQDTGIKVLRNVESTSLGERSLLVADPDGYAVMLSENSALMN
ncbi:MAG: VOC family protein [Armatimonadetes bacterium]|nr:VOC family protein [Armatimonadota bacterium]